MVNAGGDFILALIWFLIVLLTCLTIENSTSGQLMDEDTKGPVLKLDLHGCVLAACAKAYVFMESFPRDAGKMKAYCLSFFQKDKCCGRL